MSSNSPNINEMDESGHVLCVDVRDAIDEVAALDIVYRLLKYQIRLTMEHEDAAEMEYVTMAFTVAVYRDSQKIWSWTPEDLPRKGDACFEDSDGAFRCLEDIHDIYNEFLIEAAKIKLPVMENVRIAVGLEFTFDN